MQEPISQEEALDVQRIVYQFFIKQSGSRAKADEMMSKLANLLQDPGIRLIHFENTVFMMILVKPRVAEIHTMAIDEDSSTLARHFVLLAKFLKNIGVLEAYTYSDDPRFKAVAKRTRLPIETEEIEAEDGGLFTVYRLRFE